MGKLLIVYHSHSGNIEAMAQAVNEGALATNATPILKMARQATPDDLLDCDAVVSGTPTYFGYMTGSTKDLLERTWLTVGDQTANKPYSTFGSATSGQTSALDSTDRVLDSFNSFKNFHFAKASDGVAAAGEPSPEALERCRQLGKNG
jgi:multimeric flavodoxin WrbA